MRLSPDHADERRDGFRLQCLEVYNWGTFNRQVWTVEPCGSTALLTGANGSGKSTLVDALLTLLVPNMRRNYNQASGADKRRERDEKSYVRGAYGRIKDEENSRGIVQYLRGKDDYAVLLASFANRPLGQEVTLAQLFFWKENELKKLYIVAARRLSIAEHLQITSTPDELRRRLKGMGAEVYEEFSRYSRHVIKLFHLRSEKALDLFNQTVSIKEIGGLNDFVRQHMLEKTDTGEKITRLRETYQNLTRAHDAIAKAEQQLARLAPLLAEAEQHQQLQARIAETERCTEIVPLYFARRKLELAQRAIETSQHELTQCHATRTTYQEQLEHLRAQERTLYAAITNDKVGQEIERLERDIGHAQERMHTRRRAAEKYDRLVAKLGLPVISDEATFLETVRTAREGLPRLDQRLRDLNVRRDAHKQEEGRLRGLCQEIQSEIESLRQRKSRIPANDLVIRARLSQTLKIAEDELPFIGELLKVRDDARLWEGAIERLLRGYGCQLLVPEKYYRQVMGYVDSTNLRGRLVYHRADERRTPRSTAGIDADALVFKLEIKPDSALHDWLKADLVDHWDYVCCETIEQFQRERRALTIKGQVKRGGARHEKDDSFAINDRTRYVLGWDNRDKVAALEALRDAHARDLQAVLADIAEQEKKRGEFEGNKRDLHTLLEYDRFADLNWRDDERQIGEWQARMQALRADADHLKLLETQRDQLLAQIAGAERKLAEVQGEIGTLESEIRRYERQRAESAARLGTLRADAIDAYAARIEADSKGRKVTLDGIDDAQNQMERFYTQSAASLRGQANTYERGLFEKMVNFKRDYPEDTADMDAAIEAIGEYRRMYERLDRDDLPAHRKRFKEWLDGKVVDAIVGFQSTLDKKVAEYRESIDTLNGSLHTIAYTGATYIQLTADVNRDREVQEFRQSLRACIPDVGQRTPEANEASFQHIRALIGRFEKEERWTAKVTDVRNWLDFAAEERYIEDDAVKNYYSDSSGKSGGQKAKLAYTILASAIAYQYGLVQDEAQTRTFRFVVVDEAFSKSDETNARYAMDLFKQLNLQLLVVTPLDKTHVVEPYIAACHFVTNTQDENDSRVINMTIQQYHAQKATFASLVQVAS